MKEQADIDNYISSQAEESINLEFKRGDALKSDDKTKAEIAKDISAFANSDGGTIIYGLEEKDHKAAGLAFVNGNDFTKEWLEQIINSRIQRKIEGLTIEPVRYDGQIDKSVYVVTIPRSNNSPHMAGGKFYRRYNFQAVVMEEYEVRDLYNRRDKTNLEIENIRANGYGDRTNSFSPGLNFHQAQYSDKLKSFTAAVRFDIINKGKTIERYWKAEFLAPNGFILSSAIRGPILQPVVREVGSYQIFAIPNSSPLFQREIATVEVGQIRILPGSLNDLLNYSFTIKLFYSTDIKESSFKLLDLITDNGKPLTADDFRQ